MAWIRTTAIVVGLVGGLSISPIVPAAVILLLSLRWRAPEVLFLGLFLDLFYLPSGHAPLFTIGAVAAQWILEPLRKEFLA